MSLLKNWIDGLRFWMKTEIPQMLVGFKHLPNLKVLDLCGSYNLVRTPDFEGLPCLERLILLGCESLKEIHPSIGYHERLIFLDMEACRSLKLFPPIFRMKKLETLLLTGCIKLCKFPEILTSMDNLVKLSLKRTGIVIVPSSVGRYCTNLVSLDLSDCLYLHSIKGNFYLLKHFKGLYLDGCYQLKNMPTEGLFDVECCLQLLSLSSTSLKNLNRGAMKIEFLGFSRCVRRLNLGWCKLVDGDISSVFWEELPNLEALDLSGNDFSRLHSRLSQLPRLKFLDLSWCKDLVELPDLPSTISILIAAGCCSLDVVDFPTNLKWLWKVSLSAKKFNGERVLQSMLKGNAIEDYFISVQLHDNHIPSRGFARRTSLLQLPGNFPTFLKWLWKILFSASKFNGERVLQSMPKGNAIEDYFITDHQLDDDYNIPTRGFARGTLTFSVELVQRILWILNIY